MSLKVCRVEPKSFRLLRNLGRTREIVVVLLNHGFGDVVDRLGLRTAWHRWKRRFFKSQDKPVHRLRTVERLRLALEALGPTFIKFGQVMSTRPDIIPPDMLAELQRLQEHCPPFPAEVAVAQVEAELNQPIGKLFLHFERVPLAAGSLGQVHRAVDFDGAQLAVKIRRPQIERDVERDLSLMHDLALLLERHVPESRVFDPSGLVTHFGRTIRRELNFAREGRTMEEFRRAFADEPGFAVAPVMWNRTTEAVLTMGYVDGCRIDDPVAIARLPVRPTELAALGARLYFRQAFELGVFHGDPHPGNIRLLADGRLVLLDYGMVGLIDPQLREQLVDLLASISRRDVDTMRQIVLSMGDHLSPIDLTLLDVDLRDFLGNYYGVPLDQIQVGRLLADFVNILSTNAVRCPPSLILLIRAMVTLDGIGRQLDPAFNLASHLQPFIEALARQRYQPEQMGRKVLQEVQQLARLMHRLPGRLSGLLTQVEAGQLKVRLEHHNLEQLIVEMERASNRLVVGVVVAALILASALILPSNVNTFWISVPINIVSSVLALWLVYGIFRSGRL